MTPISFKEDLHRLKSFTRLPNGYESIMGDVARYELVFLVPILFGFIWIELKRKVRFYLVAIDREEMESKWDKLIEK